MSDLARKWISAPTRRVIGQVPNWRWLLLTLATVVFTCLAVSGWLMNAWAKQTMHRFVQSAQNGDAANCRAMLTEDCRGYSALGADSFRRVFDGPATAEPISLMDFMRGRQLFRVPRKWVDGHIIVERGRVTLDEDFLFREIEAPVFFKLTKQVQAIEEYKVRHAGERQVGDEP
jgi:hypothetical protein